MSVHVTSWVLRHSPARLADRLVLLVLADHAGDDGTNAFPSQETIAFETITSDRNVRRSLAKMEESGWIKRDGFGTGGTVNYTVVMDPAEWLDPTEFRDRTNCPPDEEGIRTNRADDPDKSDQTVSEMSDEPSNNHQEPKDTSTSKDDVARKVFDYWVKATDRNPKRVKFTDQRRGKIKARLREGYTPRQLCLAIKGAMRSNFHVEGGYTDLVTILRDGAQVEKFEALVDEDAGAGKYTFDAIRDARQVMTGEEREKARAAGEYPFDARAEAIVARGGS